MEDRESIPTQCDHISSAQWACLRGAHFRHRLDRSKQPLPGDRFVAVARVGIDGCHLLTALILLSPHQDYELVSKEVPKAAVALKRDSWPPDALRLE